MFWWVPMSGWSVCLTKNGLLRLVNFCTVRRRQTPLGVLREGDATQL